jgi:hypothetical protein
MPADTNTEGITLVDVLDRVLNKGVVVLGDLTISVADVDLIYLRLNLLLASVAKLDSMAKSASSPAETAHSQQ